MKHLDFKKTSYICTQVFPKKMKEGVAIQYTFFFTKLILQYWRNKSFILPPPLINFNKYYFSSPIIFRFPKSFFRGYVLLTGRFFTCISKMKMTLGGLNFLTRKSFKILMHMKTRMLNRMVLILTMILWAQHYAMAQVAINSTGDDPHASAMLDVTSTDKGVLIPRMTATQRDAISNPANGLLVYVTDDNQFYYYDYDAAKWFPFGKPDKDWKVEDVNMYSLPTGNVGIGTTSPDQKFTVNGVVRIYHNYDAGADSDDNGDFIIGEIDDQHLEIDNDEISSLSDNETPSTLGIQVNGGRVEMFITHEGTLYMDTAFVHINSPNDAGINQTPDGIGGIILGKIDGEHLEIDDNEIHALDDQSTPGMLLLNWDGGRVRMGHLGGTEVQVGINTSNYSYALNLPNNSTNNIGKARAYDWVSYSDGRLKTNIQPITNPIDILEKLRPVHYFHHNSRFLPYDDEKAKKVTGIEILDNGEFTYGFIAQEVYKVLPEIVEKPENEDTELWSLNYIRLIPILTAAIQEQQKIIKAHEEEIRKLKSQIQESSN